MLFLNASADAGSRFDDLRTSKNLIVKLLNHFQKNDFETVKHIIESTLRHYMITEKLLCTVRILSTNFQKCHEFMFTKI